MYGHHNVSFCVHTRICNTRSNIAFPTVFIHVAVTVWFLEAVSTGSISQAQQQQTFKKNSTYRLDWYQGHCLNIETIFSGIGIFIIMGFLFDCLIFILGIPTSIGDSHDKDKAVMRLIMSYLYDGNAYRLCYLYHGNPCTGKKTFHIDGLVQERHNSIANALELCLSCTNSSILRWNLGDYDKSNLHQKILNSKWDGHYFHWIQL